MLLPVVVVQYSDTGQSNPTRNVPLKMDLFLIPTGLVKAPAKQLDAMVRIESGFLGTATMITHAMPKSKSLKAA